VRVLHADKGGKVLSDLILTLNEAKDYAEMMLQAVETAASLLNPGEKWEPVQ
jgi:hypothetical protein